MTNDQVLTATKPQTNAASYTSRNTALKDHSAADFKEAMLARISQNNGTDQKEDHHSCGEKDVSNKKTSKTEEHTSNQEVLLTNNPDGKEAVQHSFGHFGIVAINVLHSETNSATVSNKSVAQTAVQQTTLSDVPKMQSVVNANSHLVASDEHGSDNASTIFGTNAAESVQQTNGFGMIKQQQQTTQTVMSTQQIIPQSVSKIPVQDAQKGQVPDGLHFSKALAQQNTAAAVPMQQVSPQNNVVIEQAVVNSVNASVLPMVQTDGKPMGTEQKKIPNLSATGKTSLAAEQKQSMNLSATDKTPILQSTEAGSEHSQSAGYSGNHLSFLEDNDTKQHSQTNREGKNPLSASASTYLGNESVSMKSATSVHSVAMEAKPAEQHSADQSQLYSSVTNQVMEHIKDNFTAGKNEFEIQLQPENLGKITVKMAVKSSAMVVEILAANKDTQSILSSGSLELRSMLQNRFDSTVNVQIVSEDKNQYLNHSGEHGSGNHRNYEQQENHKEQADDNQNYTGDFLSLMELIGNARVG